MLNYFIFDRTLDEMLEEKAAQRKAETARRARIAEIGWKSMDLKSEKYDYERVPDFKQFLTFSFRSSTLVGLFTTFYDKKLVRKIWESRTWRYKGTKVINWGKLSYKLLYKFLAMMVYIIGKQNKPNEGNPGKRPLRTAIEEAQEFFKDYYEKPPGISVTEYLATHFLLTNDYFKDLSSNFQSIVVNLGQSVAGDEKLLHFTGDSKDVRLCLTKPDRIGLWFYELCGFLENGLSYMLYVRLHDANKKLRETIHVVEIVQEWIDVVKRVHTEEEVWEPKTLLCMDSYYLDNASRSVLKESKVRYIAATAVGRFKELYKLVSAGAKEQGDWNGAFNEEYNEVVVYCNEIDQDIGKKLVLSNAFSRSKGKSDSSLIPVYDHYACIYNACDLFNRNLHDRHWPHRTGGKHCSGDRGLQNTMAMACILQNTFNCFQMVQHLESENFNFHDHCLQLSRDLYEYSCSPSLDLPDDNL